MHKITTEGPTYLLRVELRSYEREFIFAEYSNFSIGPESDNYTLHVTGYLKYSTAGSCPRSISIEIYVTVCLISRGITDQAFMFCTICSY